MFRAGYNLPNIIGQEINNNPMHPPTSVRVYVDPVDVTTPDVDFYPAAQQLVNHHAGHISQWVQATRQVAYAGANTFYSRQLQLEGVTCVFQINYQQETLTLWVRPTLAGGSSDTTFFDVRSIFYKWPIPGSRTHGNPPPAWEFAAQFPAQGNMQGIFYSFYDPAFAPGDRNSGVPAMADTGTQPTSIYEDFKWYGDNDLDPAHVGGYVEELWLTEESGTGIGGTGYYDVLLKDKQYWEVEIKALPTEVPTAQTHALPNADNGTSYEDPTVRTTLAQYTMKYPAGLNTFLNPVIGVIPKHFAEPFTPPAKSKSYSLSQLNSLPQIPPRDNIRFTHKIIGLDPTLDKPRSIGAVRSSVIKGDEVLTLIFPAQYRVDITTSYGPLFWESSTASDVYDNRVPPHYYATNSIPSGWDQFGSSSSLSFFLCSMNPYWDIDPSLRPAIRGTQTIAENQFLAAGGDIYMCVNYNALNQAREATGTPSPLHGPWTIPKGGPPPGFVAPGAPAKQYPVGVAGAPYFRCCGIIGTGDSSTDWIGPAYPWITAGPRYDDPGSSFPTAGAVTEVRNGVAVPDTVIHATATTYSTDTFPDQLFGDFLRQPDDDESGRHRREVVVPYGKSDGRYMPVIKGRGDNIVDHYRDVVTEDSNYTDGGSNFGYDTGVDLGDPKVGDRLMFASDTATGKLWIGINGVWKGPDGADSDPARGIGHACLMDREVDPATGRLKPAEYYAAASYKYGLTWVRLWLGRGLKYKVPSGYGKLGQTTT